MADMELQRAECDELPKSSANLMKEATINFLGAVYTIFVVCRNYGFFVFDYIKRALQTLPRDLRGLYLHTSMMLDIRRRVTENRPIHHVFLEQVRVRKHPRKNAIIEIETGRRLNFEELNQLCNQYANFFLSRGFKTGDVVALFMENSIDFLAIWIVIHNARRANLVPENLPIFVSDVDADEDTSVVSLKTHMATASKCEPDSTGVGFFSILCYIYTSGTTGHPKPSIIKHYRYYWFAAVAGRAFGIQPNDRIYITLPLYHTSAGIMGFGQTILLGTTAVIRKKFSASNFWKDCAQYQCTASQYIGEICRYLLAQKPSVWDQKHNVRLMWGNGLRAEIWAAFQERFGVVRMGEVYGSTEGNVAIANLNGHIGACGSISSLPFARRLQSVHLVQVDEETGEVLRDKNGLCIPCQPGMTGQIVATIKNIDKLVSFDGYVNAQDTQKKVLENCFAKGDKAFSSGDLLYWDKFGYLYFKDRIGDSFRWKGENVSTIEVEGILQHEKDVVDITVYGVEIPKMEGRAGMASIVLNKNVNIEDFIVRVGQQLTANLPSYATPVFIRFVNKLETTGTHKLRKSDLQKQGFDLEKANGDTIYYYDVVSKSYSPLDQLMFDAIMSGKYNRL